MVKPGSDLTEPGFVPLSRPAKLLLDSGVNENPIYLGK